MNKNFRKVASLGFGILISLFIFFMIGLLIPETSRKDYTLKKESTLFFAKIKKEEKITDEPNTKKRDIPEINQIDLGFKADSDFKVKRNNKIKDFEPKEKIIDDDFKDLFEKKELDKKRYLPFQKEVSKKNIKTAFDYSEVNEKPYIIKSIKPDFPFRAKRRGIKHGKIVLKFMVDKDGIPKKIEVVSSSHEDIFNESAIKALNEWRFYPGIMNGKKVNTILFLPVKYELKD